MRVPAAVHAREAEAGEDTGSLRERKRNRGKQKGKNERAKGVQRQME